MSAMLARIATVALLAEGVDRNSKAYRFEGKDYTSPSSQRAWIEIRGSSLERQLRWVALLAEGVDRNSVHWHQKNPARCRPPRRGRG